MASLSQILDSLFHFALWPSRAPINPYWLAVGLLCIVLPVYLRLEHGEVIQRYTPTHRFYDLTLRLGVLMDGARTILGVFTGAARWSAIAIPGIQARRYARILREGNSVLPMNVETDRRHRDGPIRIENNRSTIVTGKPGAGKTELIKVLMAQLSASPDEPVVVLDVKNDYQRFLENRDTDLVRVNPMGSDVVWNLFEEVENEHEIREVSKSIVDGLADDKYWGVAAQQVITGVITLLYREIPETGHTPTNADIVEYLRAKETEEIHADLERHDDLADVAEHIPDDGAQPQTQGVVANVQASIQEMFFGSFAKSAEDSFSMREYMHNPDGRVLVLDVPASMTDTVGPVYKFLLDWCIRHSLSDETPATFVLDEFAGLPALNKMNPLVNRGRSYNSRAIVGVQSIAQLQETYGKSATDALLSGFTQRILMQAGDPETVEFSLESIGVDVNERHVADYTGDETNRRSVPDQVTVTPIPETELKRFDPGELVFVGRNGSWVRGHAYELETVEDVLMNASTFAER